MATNGLKKNSPEEQKAIKNFIDYIKIKSVQPKPDYAACMSFLQHQAESLSLPWKIKECVPGKPIFYMTWEGTQPQLPSIMLNSHTDVVPVYPEHWKYGPFDGHIDEDGNIYGRGTQDMKCVAIQYLEAIRRVKAQGKKFARTIHLTFVPDEEIGGQDGMKKFVHTEEFKKMNVGFTLDEGIASETEAFNLYYGERAVWQIQFKVSGTPGHGLFFIEATCGEKMRSLLNSFIEFREKEKQVLESNPNLGLADVTTVNLVILNGGVQANVVPPEFYATFDCRISHSLGTEKFELLIQEWCQKAGRGITYTFIQKCNLVKNMDISDANPWWVAVKGVFDKMKLKVKPQVFAGFTDSRFIRELGIMALGFSPMNNTPLLLHNHDEYLNKDVFLRGIDIYSSIIPALANMTTK